MSQLGSSKKRWTKAEDDVLAEGIAQNASYLEISKALGRSEKSVAMRAYVKRGAATAFAKHAPAKRKAVPVSTQAAKPEKHYVPVVDVESINQNFSRLYAVGMASLLCSFATFVLISAVLLAG